LSAEEVAVRNRLQRQRQLTARQVGAVQDELARLRSATDVAARRPLPAPTAAQTANLVQAVAAYIAHPHPLQQPESPTPVGATPGTPVVTKPRKHRAPGRHDVHNAAPPRPGQTGRDRTGEHTPPKRPADTVALSTPRTPVAAPGAAARVGRPGATAARVTPRRHHARTGGGASAPRAATRHSPAMAHASRGGISRHVAGTRTGTHAHLALQRNDRARAHDGHDRSTMRSQCGAKQHAGCQRGGTHRHTRSAAGCAHVTKRSSGHAHRARARTAKRLGRGGPRGEPADRHGGGMAGRAHRGPGEQSRRAPGNGPGARPDPRLATGGPVRHGGTLAAGPRRRGVGERGGDDRALAGRPELQRGESQPGPRRRAGRALAAVLLHPAGRGAGGRQGGDHRATRATGSASPRSSARPAVSGSPDSAVRKTSSPP
jgi:hypothetical protein